MSAPRARRATATNIPASMSSPAAKAARPGPCVHFNGHLDVVQTGAGWTLDPFAGIVKDGKVYGRGACDMKGGLAAAVVAVEALIEFRHRAAGRAGNFRHGGRGVRRLWRRRLSGRAGLVFQTAGRSCDHSRALERRPGLHRPSRRVVGGDRDPGPHRPWLDALSGRQRHPPYDGSAGEVRARTCTPRWRRVIPTCRWCLTARANPP